MSVFVLRRCAGVLVLGALAACGGSDVGPVTSDLLQISDAAEAQQLRVFGDIEDPDDNGFALTRVEVIPDDRTVNFKGYSGIITLTEDAQQNIDGFLVLGESVITVDFAQQTFDGEVTNMIGTDFAEDVYAVTGDFIYTGGVINAAKANEFLLDYEIDISIGDTPLELSGTMDGEFRGTRADAGDRNPVKALAGEDYEPTILVGEDVVAAGVFVTGESWLPN